MGKRNVSGGVDGQGGGKMVASSPRRAKRSAFSAGGIHKSAADTATPYFAASRMEDIPLSHPRSGMRMPSVTGSYPASSSAMGMAFGPIMVSIRNRRSWRSVKGGYFVSFPLVFNRKQCKRMSGRRHPPFRLGKDKASSRFLRRL